MIKKGNFTRSMQDLQERVARKTKTKRLKAPKSNNLSEDYKQFALFAKRVQTYATSIGFKTLANVARQYKIDIKNAYSDLQKTLQECGYSNKPIDALSDLDRPVFTIIHNKYYEYMRRLSSELATIVQQQTQNMVSIYSDAYKFMDHFYKHGDLSNIQIPLPTSGQYVEEPKINNCTPQPLTLYEPEYTKVKKPEI